MFTSESSITNTGKKTYQYLAAVTANLGIICSDMHHGWSSPSLPILTSGNYSFKISIEEESWLAVIPLIGAIFGAIITSFIADIFGRKPLIVFSSIPFIISWLLIAVAQSSVLMFVGRFIAGMMDGLSLIVVLMYLGEIAEPKIRGLISAMCPLCTIFGVLVINILGSYFSIVTTAYISMSVPILLFVTFIWMPESPYFYLMKGKKEQARRSLQQFSGHPDVSMELERISDAIEKQNRDKGNVLDLVRVESNRRALVLALGLRGIQQLSGTNAIIFFCKEVFEESHDFISPSVATMIYFAVQFVLSVLASAKVDSSGRRPLLIVSTTGTALALFLNGAYLYVQNCTEVDTSSFNFLPLVAMLSFVILFSMGLETIPLLILGEVFPTNVKASALCVADIYYNIIVTLVSMFFHWSNNSFGMHVPFFTFGCCCVLGLIFIVLFVPETKGKSLEDIQMELKGSKK